MIELMLRLMSEIDIAIEYKRIEQAVGKSMFPVTQLARSRDRTVVEARVVFGTEAPFVQGQVVEYYMASVRMCTGTVVRLDGHSATVEFARDHLPGWLVDDLETMAEMEVGEAFVALPMLRGLEGYAVEELMAIKGHLENTYQLLISLLEGGAR